MHKMVSEEQLTPCPPPPPPPPPPPHPTPQDTLVLGQDVPRLVALGPNEPLSVWSVPHPV